MLLSYSVLCNCGKVQAAIQSLESSPPLRLVCYCRDCRGYYETLNRLGKGKGLPPAALLDNWGGVDWTFIYPRDIQMQKGKDLLTTRIMRPGSPIRLVYSTCCYTPMFRFGSNSVLLNSGLIPNESKTPVEFRIIGRQAVKQSTNGEDKPRPTISWSVPIRWFWIMFPRVKKDLMEPMPINIPKEVPVLEDFKEG